jgi:flagellar assembly protein FliH
MNARQSSTNRSTILVGEPAKNMPTARFDRFGDRPVNYHKGIVPESGESASLWNEEEVSRRLEQQMGVAQEAFTKERDAAHSKGYEEGLTKGREEGSQQIQPAIELLQDWGRVLQSEKEELARHYETDVLELGFRIAEKIIGLEISTRQEAVLSIVQQALRKIVNADEVIVRANPEDLRILEQAREKLMSEVGIRAPLELRPDSSIARGGCVIDTESGMLDAQLHSQMNRLRTQITEVKAETTEQL